MLYAAANVSGRPPGTIGFTSPGLSLYVAMDEKTEELRDIFMSVSDDETLVEEQKEKAITATQSAEERMEDVIGTLQSEHDVELREEMTTVIEIVKEYFQDRSDEEIADELDTPEDAVAHDRITLHLFHESDPPLGLENTHERARERVGKTDGEYRHRLQRLVDELDLLHGNMTAFDIDDGLDGAVSDPDVGQDDAF